MISGFLNINKKKAQTSFEVIRNLKRIFKAQEITDIAKIGHTGTLDPLAEGVLVIAVGEATKFIEFFNLDDKSYIAEVVLGEKSDTFDADGKIQKVSQRKPAIIEIENILKKFIGDILQTPPLYSAIKVKGVRAYKLAREGKNFHLAPRKIYIQKINIIEYDYPFLKLGIDCSKGTYIRSLCNDIGNDLGVGAHLNNLKRTRVGRFFLKDSVNIEDINKNGIKRYIIAFEDVFAHFPRIDLNLNEYNKLKNGQKIYKPGLKNGIIFKDSIEIFAAFLNNKFVGILKKFNDTLKFKKQLIKN
jgi:tRNA pseudouridine55 synthase